MFNPYAAYAFANPQFAHSPYANGPYAPFAYDAPPIIVATNQGPTVTTPTVITPTVITPTVRIMPRAITTTTQTQIAPTQIVPRPTTPTQSVQTQMVQTQIVPRPSTPVTVRPSTPLSMSSTDAKTLFNIPLETLYGLTKPMPKRWKNIAAALAAISAASPEVTDKINAIIQQVTIEHWKSIVNPELNKFLALVKERGLELEFSGSDRVRDGIYELLLRAIVRIRPDEFSRTLPSCIDGRMSPENMHWPEFVVGGPTKLHAILNLVNKVSQFLLRNPDFRRFDSPMPSTKLPTYTVAPVTLDEVQFKPNAAVKPLLPADDLPAESIIGECKSEPDRCLQTVSTMVSQLVVLHPSIRDEAAKVIQQLEDEYQKSVSWQKLEELARLQQNQGVRVEFASGTHTTDGITETLIRVELSIIPVTQPWMLQCGPLSPSSRRQTFTVCANSNIRAIAYAIDAAHRFLDSNPDFRHVHGSTVRADSPTESKFMKLFARAT